MTEQPRCLFCDHTLDGRSKKFCTACLPPHGEWDDPREYFFRYNLLRSIVGRAGNQGKRTYSKIPKGHPAWKKPAPRATSQAKAPCPSCGAGMKPGSATCMACYRQSRRSRAHEAWTLEQWQVAAVVRFMAGIYPANAAPPVDAAETPLTCGLCSNNRPMRRRFCYECAPRNDKDALRRAHSSAIRVALARFRDRHPSTCPSCLGPNDDGGYRFRMALVDRAACDPHDLVARTTLRALTLLEQQTHSQRGSRWSMFCASCLPPSMAKPERMRRSSVLRHKAAKALMPPLESLPDPECPFCGGPRTRQSSSCAECFNNAIALPRRLEGLFTLMAWPTPCKVYVDSPNKRRNLATRRARANRTSDKPTVQRLAARDGWTCHLCRKAVDPTLIGTKDKMRPSVDHLIPISAGGSDDMANTALAHLRCNARRGTGGTTQLRLTG